MALSVGRLLNDSKKEAELQRVCLSLTRWMNSTFPGSQPVSLQRRHIHQDLLRSPYVAAEKTDGVRYLLLAQTTGVYLVDRNFKFWQVPLHLPRLVDGNIDGIHNDTLLDGELVQDTVNGVKVLRYLIYDLVTCHGENYVEHDLLQRLSCIQSQIITPRDIDMKRNPAPYQQQPFEMYVKDFFQVWDLEFIFNQVIPVLPHANDGIIFTPIKCAYIPGTCQKLLKWKPADMNTVDFQLNPIFKSRTQAHFQIYIANKATKQFHDWITLDPAIQAEFIGMGPKCSDKIIECYYDEEWPTFIPSSSQAAMEDGQWRKGGWRYERVRFDKNLPNDVSVLSKIERSIKDAVGKDELIGALNSKRPAGKRPLAPEDGHTEPNKAPRLTEGDS